MAGMYVTEGRDSKCNTEVRREILGVIGVNSAVGSRRIEETINQLDY